VLVMGHGSAADHATFAVVAPVADLLLIGTLPCPSDPEVLVVTVQVALHGLQFASGRFVRCELLTWETSHFVYLPAATFPSRRVSSGVSAIEDSRYTRYSPRGGPRLQQCSLC